MLLLGSKCELDQLSKLEGYTDLGSDLSDFIFENTLCIPTIFVFLYGRSPLDFKTPLLKSIEAIQRCGDTDLSAFWPKCKESFKPSLGSRASSTSWGGIRHFFPARPDLVMAGRNVFGHQPARGPAIGWFILLRFHPFSQEDLMVESK